jgi:hypothetical protein
VILYDSRVFALTQKKDRLISSGGFSFSATRQKLFMNGNYISIFRVAFFQALPKMQKGEI